MTSIKQKFRKCCKIYNEMLRNILLKGVIVLSIVIVLMCSSTYKILVLIKQKYSSLNVSRHIVPP